MKFSTREDIEAPIEHVWEQVSDFDRFEKQALRRGAEVQRNDTSGTPGLGSTWQIKFVFRGKPREVEAAVVEFDQPNSIVLDGMAGGLQGMSRIELLALSPRRTRLSVTLDLNPRNLSGRLLVQSLKFARHTLQKRYQARVLGFAEKVAERYGGPV